jgi:hypothetical protein
MLKPASERPLKPASEVSSAWAAVTFIQLNHSPEFFKLIGWNVVSGSPRTLPD